MGLHRKDLWRSLLSNWVNPEHNTGDLQDSWECYLSSNTSSLDWKAKRANIIKQDYQIPQTVLEGNKLITLLNCKNVLSFKKKEKYIQGQRRGLRWQRLKTQMITLRSWNLREFVLLEFETVWDQWLIFPFHFLLLLSPMKFCGGEGNNDIGSQQGEESFYLQGLWSQEHGEICWFCSQFLLLDLGSNHSCGRCSAVERNEILSFLASRPAKGPLGAGMSWRGCKEEHQSRSVMSDSLRPHGLEWVAFLFSRASSQPRDQT